MVNNNLYKAVVSKLTIYNLNHLIFLALTLLSVHYVFATKFFVTLDGCGHVATANILANFNSSAFFQSNFNLNYSVPNSFSHLLLAFLIKLTNPFDAEKILVLIYFVVTPLTFVLASKSFIINQNNNQKIIRPTILVFAILYNFLFHLGFYNFSLAVIFLNIHLFLVNKFRINKGKLTGFYLCINLVALYYTHGLVFLLALLYSGLIFLFSIKRDKTSFIQFFLTHIIPIVILVYNFFKFKFSNYNDDLGAENKLTKLFNFSPNVVYVEADKYLNYVYLTLFALIGIYGLYYTKTKGILNFNHPRFTVILICLILLIALFAINSGSLTGMFSDRAVFLFYYLLILMLSTIEIKHIVFQIVIIATLLFVFKSQYKERKASLSALNNNAKDVYSMIDNIEESTYIYSINRSDNWLHNHFASYLTYKKNAIIINDNHANLGWFITMYKNPDKIYQMYINIQNKNYDKLNVPNYICLLGSEERLKRDTLFYNFITEHYSQIDSRKNMCVLYKLK